MKMFKKIMAVALVGVMALSMLTGCAITDAIIENKAKDALENAWSTVKKEDVKFKSGNFTSKDAYKRAEAMVKNGTTKVEEDKASLAYADKDYIVVVVAQPKDAKKVKSWKGLAATVLEKATWGNGIYLDGTNSKTAKVDIETGIKGKDAKDATKDDTYTIFVFARTKTAYDA